MHGISLYQNFFKKNRVTRVLHLYSSCVVLHLGSIHTTAFCFLGVFQSCPFYFPGFLLCTREFPWNLICSRIFLFISLYSMMRLNVSLNVFFGSLTFLTIAVHIVSLSVMFLIISYFIFLVPWSNKNFSSFTSNLLWVIKDFLDEFEKFFYYSFFTTLSDYKFPFVFLRSLICMKDSLKFPPWFLDLSENYLYFFPWFLVRIYPVIFPSFLKWFRLYLYIFPGFLDMFQNFLIFSPLFLYILENFPGSTEIFKNFPLDFPEFLVCLWIVFTLENFPVYLLGTLKWIETSPLYFSWVAWCVWEFIPEWERGAISMLLPRL